MVTLIGVIGFVTACGAAYIIYKADFEGVLPDYAHMYLIILFIAVMVINMLIAPNIVQDSGRPYETDSGWMLICLVSAIETAIIFGIYAAGQLIADKRENKRRG